MFSFFHKSRGVGFCSRVKGPKSCRFRVSRAGEAHAPPTQITPHRQLCRGPEACS